MQHANDAIDEVRRAEFFRKGGGIRGLVKGKRWLLLSRWINLTAGKRQELNQLFALNRKVFKAYLLKESLDRLWTYRYEGAMLNYLQRWIDQLRWQRLEPFQKLALMLLDHLDGILNYCRTKVPLGVVEAVNGNLVSHQLVHAAHDGYTAESPYLEFQTSGYGIRSYLHQSLRAEAGRNDPLRSKLSTSPPSRPGDFAQRFFVPHRRYL